jgi:tripartite-type tricarboxylate transporter receptor subunit TctC
MIFIDYDSTVSSEEESMKKSLGLFFAALFAAAAWAQPFPSKPVRLVVGFSAGGPTDVIARILAQDMGATFGQSVIVENKAGAASMIATQEVKRSAPDGYTLYMTTLTHSVNAILHADKKPYDPINDFTPISLVAYLPLVMVAKGDSPFNNPTDVVNAAKAKPGEISYASSGTGGSAHLAGALVEALTHTQMLHVPFKGNAPALAEVMAGRISFMFYPMVGISDLVAQQRLKVLGVSTEKRHPDYPNVPTMSESGFPGFEEYTQGLGVVGPAGLPPMVVSRLNEAIRASLAKPDTKEKLSKLGAITEGGSTPAEFRAWLAKDLERWARVIKAANVKAD